MAPVDTSKTSRGDLGRILVIGGNGFLGHHIVRQALSSWTASSVASVDLHCDRNRENGAAYHECDITDASSLSSLLENIKPDVVIHTASPIASGSVEREVFRKVNVDGTAAVIKACQQASVTALVYTSSASVVNDSRSDLINADERWPVLRGASQPEYYSETKAHAEELVLKANRCSDDSGSKLLTAAIRPAGIFGEGDVQLLAGLLKVWHDGRTNVQIGGNTNIFDFTYVGNVAHAHLIAAQMLLATAKASTAPLDHEKVDGEAFFITNDSPVYFWDFARAVWAAAGCKTPPSAVWHLSADLGYFLAGCAEWWGFLTRTQPTFNRMRVTLTTISRYYNIIKAKRVLRYEPIYTLREGIDRGVSWFLDQDKKEATAKAQ